VRTIEVAQDKDKNKKLIVCPTKTCEDIKVSVPVEVRTNTQIGDIILKCNGSHILKKQDKLPSVSKFEIVQEISAEIPINFITEVEVKDEHVDFDVHACE